MKTWKPWAFLACCLFLIVACARQEPAQPMAELPEPPQMPEDGILLYWVVALETPADEVIVVHQDGRVTYEDRAQGRTGQQFVGLEGLLHFRDVLALAGFQELEPSHLPRKGETARDRYVTLMLREGDAVHQVQWQEPARPSALDQAAQELDQFLQVVRASAQ